VKWESRDALRYGEKKREICFDIYFGNMYHFKEVKGVFVSDEATKTFSFVAFFVDAVQSHPETLVYA